MLTTDPLFWRDAQELFRFLGVAILILLIGTLFMYCAFQCLDKLWHKSPDSTSQDTETFSSNRKELQ